MEPSRWVGTGEPPVLPADSFIGRGAELEKIEIQLGSVRMITLCGPGGIGKTRLAAEVVRRIGKSKSNSSQVYWVRLARLAVDSDPAAIVREIAHTVVGVDFSQRSEWDALIDTLSRNRHLILVLDNCEHLAASAARVAADLFLRIPELRVLATSRRPLGWADEYLVPVPPLTRDHALALFRSRAELTGHPVAGTAQIDIAAEICRHVHYHPLYIQLAAARLRHQPIVHLVAGLTGRHDDTRLSWSHGFRSGADPRHRGVTDVIAWSYQLCTDKERLLFDRLAVFAVGYDTNPEETSAGVIEVGADLDAICSVCGDDSSESGSDPEGLSLSEGEIEDLLERLVDHALVSVHMTADKVRYSLVESLHAFAGQRLRERTTAKGDEAARLAARHLHYYRDKITRAASERTGSDGHDLRGWTRSSWHDIVTAIETGLTTGRPDIGLEICVGLISLRAFVTSGSIREMRRWTQRCLDASYALHPELTELQAEALTSSSWLALTQGLPDDAAQMLETCVSRWSLEPSVRAHWRDSAESDIGLPAPVEYAWGLELFAGRDARAVDVLCRARTKFDALGENVSAWLSEQLAAIAAGLLSTADQAHKISQRFAHRADRSGTLWEKSWAGLARSIVLTKHGDPAEALILQQKSLAYQFSAGDRWSGMWAVQFRVWSLARILSDELTGTDHDRARGTELATDVAHLVGGLATLRTELGVNIDALGPFADESANAIAIARRVLGDDTYTTEETRGANLRPKLDETQKLALGRLTLARPPDRPRKGPVSWARLTPAEQEVAVLVVTGRTNSTIAARRGRSVRTIDAQVTSILHKLGVTSREGIEEHIPPQVRESLSNG